MSQISLERPLSSWKQDALCSLHRRLDLGNLVNSGTILHYGCGAGYAIQRLPHAVGYEPNPKQAQQGKTYGANIYLSETKLKDGYDIVFCHERMADQQDLPKILSKLRMYMHHNSTLVLSIGKHNPHFTASRKHLEQSAGRVLATYGYKLVSVNEQYSANSKQALVFYRLFGMGFYHKIITLLGKLKKEKRFIIKAIINRG